MNNKIPQTKEECFALLDEMLSEEDKNTLKTSDDNIIFHLSLGMWIRNNWVYPLSDSELASFMDMFEDEIEGEDKLPFKIHILHPDYVSSVIIEKYVEYLKDKD